MSWFCKYQIYKDKDLFCSLLKKNCKILQKGCVLSKKTKFIIRDENDRKEKKVTKRKE